MGRCLIYLKTRNMKRSEINQLIREALQFFEEMNFKLPPWGYWSPEDWKQNSENCKEIIHNQLGWDLTDFGSGKFRETGLLLFTIRNGNLERDQKPYAEKIMIVDENQLTPMHFHWSKMEDIINRGGGNLMIQLYPSDENEELADHDLRGKPGRDQEKVSARRCGQADSRRKHYPVPGPLS